jgi:hypothetical protein
MNLKNTKIVVLIVGGFYSVSSLFAVGVLYAQKSFFEFLGDKTQGLPETQIEMVTFLWGGVKEYMPYMFVFGLALLSIGLFFHRFIKQAYLVAIALFFPFCLFVYSYAQSLKPYDELSKQHLEATFAQLETSPMGQNMIGWVKTMNSGSVSNQSYLLVFPFLLAIFFLFKQRNTSPELDENHLGED